MYEMQDYRLPFMFELWDVWVLDFSFAAGGANR